MHIQDRYLSSLKAWLLHQRVRQLSRAERYEWFHSVRKIHPDLFKPGNADSERKHRLIWGRLRKDFSPMTLRVCGNLSGVWDPYILPLEVYTSEIEKVLCPEVTSAFQAHKSLYEKCFPKGIFPHTYIHNIDGLLYDEHYQLKSETEIKEIISSITYPVVIKPNIHSKGGKDVAFIDTPDLLNKSLHGMRNYVVQERIVQHHSFDRFNSCGLNTLRCCVYRSLTDDSFQVVSMALRMGRSGRLDNLGQGGLACAIHEDGEMHTYGVDDCLNKYTQHPDSGVQFESVGRLPKYDELITMLKTAASQVWFHRLVSFDVGYDEAEHWRLIEVNLRGQTISLAQFAGLPFFGKYSEEIIEHCMLNRPWRNKAKRSY